MVLTEFHGYALAHLPQYHALEFGRSAYFLLREPALGQCSLTYFVNEARGHWGEERWDCLLYTSDAADE